MRFHSLRLALSLLALCALCGCPPSPEATRDGGTRCGSDDDCNPAGMRCGSIRACVVGYCSDSRITRVCSEGGNVDAQTGNCLQSEDCNPVGACGSLIACINYVCDPTTMIDIPCRDASALPDASEAGAMTDARPSDGALSDANDGSFSQ